MYPWNQAAETRWRPLHTSCSAAHRLHRSGQRNVAEKQGRGIQCLSERQQRQKNTLRDVHNKLHAIHRENVVIQAMLTVRRALSMNSWTTSQPTRLASSLSQTHNKHNWWCFSRRAWSASSKRFSEVILVDTTHGTNTNHYKLFSFAVTDVFGKVQFS